MAMPDIYMPEGALADAAKYENSYYAAPQTPPPPFLPPPYSPPPLSDDVKASDTSKAGFDINVLSWPENPPPYEGAGVPSAAPRPLATRKRTMSLQGSAASPSLSSTGDANNSTPTIPIPIQIHPFLNGDAPSPIFFFNVAPSAFVPQRCVSMNPPRGMLLTMNELRQPAFHPPLKSLRLLHPKLPFWPIDLALPDDIPAAEAPPISLGDILVCIHRALHTRITHTDWETLNAEEERRVTRAFVQRCRAEALRSKVPPKQLRDREIAERNQGVKRVDFLLGETVFQGLVKSPQDPEGCLRMLFGAKEGQIGGPPTADIAYWVPLSSRQHSLTSATRPRAISWHGPEASTALGNTISKSSPLLSTAYPSHANTHLVHPFLDGDAPSPIFFFDVAPLRFAPVKCVSLNPPQSAPLSEAELRESAFNPPLMSMRLLHPKLPFWPINLGMSENMTPAEASPVSLGDILVSIHRALQTRITHADWENLNPEDQQRVTVAYLKRCHTEAVRSQVPPAQLRDQEIQERNKGVKRVDFLLGKTVFKGLVRSPGDPDDCLHMIFAKITADEDGGEGSSSSRTGGPAARLSDSTLDTAAASHSNPHLNSASSLEETSAAESNLGVSGNTVSTSSVSASDHPEIHAETAQISTFVIWSPKSPRQHSQTSALNPEDIQTLKNDFAEGGTIISSHHPDDVVLWLETNYDHPLLQTMRSRGIGGPLPSMLSPEEPSLVVFGSIRDGWVVDAAEVLSELSNFAVMIRPLWDNPVPNWQKEFSFAGDPVSGENQAREDSLPDNSDDGGTDESDNDGSTTTEDSASGGLNNARGVFRLRGGASRDSYGPWIGPLHKVDVRLDICPRKGVSYNVDLLSRIQFQTQSKYENKYQRDNVVSYHGHRPQIISKTEFSVVPREGAPVKADRSYSTIGFLVEGQDITDCRWLESPALSPPRQITKTVDSEAKAKAFTIGATVSAQPEGTLSYGITSTKTNTMENQNNKVTPKCRIESWAGKRLERNQVFYDSFEIAYEAGDDLNKREEGAKYPMEVEFSMGINVADLENTADSHLPNTSFLILNQTNLWIYRSNLKTKGQGILVLTIAHIPDVAAINELRVVENQTVNLEGTSVINVPTNSPPINNPVNTSLSISAILDTKLEKKPQHLLTKLKRAAKSLRSQKTIPLRPEIETLPMHEFISRGWDARLNKWRKVMYPSLTSAFQRVSKSSDIAVWRLEVGDFSKGKQRDSGDPTTGLDETSVPPPGELHHCIGLGRQQSGCSNCFYIRHIARHTCSR
ncbi:hypothetical protein MVEN_01817400 [Mycena venus]|uniref:DUF6699 domain-containing protein n=1 Tax=Mycena venus TaxID=2733690 RepID=A0A8H6XKT5_9AGAR|nr:hypothetical protein MVEN_01817400 [Mycena venus]